MNAPDPGSLLIAELDRRREAIALRAMEEMYRDPFWDARFGERGRRFSREDGLYHLRYLREALVSDDVRVLENYARWLRSVLVPRGMCSAHLSENLSRIGRILLEEKLPDAARAAAFLGRAVAALDYDDPDLRALQHADGDLFVLGSYLADAVAAGDVSLFVKHVEWLRAFDSGLPLKLANLETLAPEGPAREAVRQVR